MFDVQQQGFRSRAGRAGGNTTKIVISNLDYGVSDQDIKVSNHFDARTVENTTNNSKSSRRACAGPIQGFRRNSRVGCPLRSFGTIARHGARHLYAARERSASVEAIQRRSIGWSVKKNRLPRLARAWSEMGSLYCLTAGKPMKIQYEDGNQAAARSFGGGE